jgi:hypothetical protein
MAKRPRASKKVKWSYILGMSPYVHTPAIWIHEEGRWQDQRDLEKSESVYYDSDDSE